MFVYFENGLRTETEILVETNFRSFVSYFNIQKMLLVILFAIKILSQVNIFKHIERKHRRQILKNVRALERLKGKWYKINKDIKFIKLCKKEYLIPTFAKVKLSIKSGNAKIQQKLAQIIMETVMQQKKSRKKKNKKRNS